MSTALRVQLFGEVRAWRDAEPVRLGPAQQRAVFAILALAGGRPVSREELVSALWGDDPPQHAASVLQTYVMHLRRSLDPGRAARAPSDVLARSGHGYLLRLAADRVDVLEFRRLAAVAREANRSGDHDACVAAAEEALRLWQATPAADLPMLADHPLVAQLAEERWAVVAWYADAALRRGTPGDALPVVEEGAAARPLDEPLHGWLIRLYAALGRRAEALGCYARLRRRLVEDLGVDPTPQLRELHQAVLRDEDPAPSGTPAAPPPTASATAEVPAATRARALPRDLVDFTGRADVLRELLAALPPADDTGTAPVIHAIDGMPGVGKTALAVHFAHLVSARYPDAQLYVDLHGHSDRTPLGPAAAVDALLRQLGVPGDRIPDQFDERVAMWRGELAGRHALLLLDNAGTAEQVGPLLPAEPGCLTLVTSRRRLVGLDGARTVSLGVLTGEEAIILQRRIVGARVDAALEAAHDVARRCGHLALAIRLAAARLAHRPAWSVADLSARLDRAETPLRELTLPGRSVEAAFALSYQDLSVPARRLFRLLGLHPGPDIDARAAAALADLDVTAADEVLAELVDTHIAEEPVTGRYRLHDLIRDYAAGLAADEPERDPAIDRLLTYYLHAAAACDSLLYPSIARLRADVGEPPPQVTPPSDSRAATDWFAAEQANIAASVRLAAATRRDQITWRLAQAGWRFLFAYGYLDECVALCELAVAAAQRAGEPHGQAAGHNNLAGVYYKRGRWDQALRHVDQAITIRAKLDQPLLHATSLANKAALLQQVGDYPAALHAANQALEIIQAHAPHANGSKINLTVGQITGWMGEEARAERYFRAIMNSVSGPHAEHGRREAQAHLGELRLWRGRFTEAAELLQEATTDWDEPMPLTRSVALAWLGSAYCGLGRLDDALRHHSQAMALAKQHSEIAVECEVAVQHAITLLAAGDTPGALEQLRVAFDICDRISLPLYEAHTATAAADVYADTDPSRAARFRARADALYTQLHVVPPVSVLAAYRAATSGGPESGASRNHGPATRS
jgi:DNA-binding SARP family transcriptional activator/tetratricopeptide (TPR) repeat protein